MDLIKALVENNFSAFKEELEDRIFDTITESEELDESMTAIVSRIRGGKLQRRKKVSTVEGYTIKDGRLVKMDVGERHRRAKAQHFGALKRQSHMAQALKKRNLSLLKRERLIGK